ncbi:MAG: cysteine-rich CWC family protein [Alistipes sp.]|jgi:hypothetical protein|nr:cysteine-rich CWC family protein [Alistipes sp.]
MRKVCPHCGNAFECCADGDISRCHCTTVPLSERQRSALKERYADCLCHRCLLRFASEQEEQ